MKRIFWMARPGFKRRQVANGSFDGYRFTAKLLWGEK